MSQAHREKRLSRCLTKSCIYYPPPPGGDTAQITDFAPTRHKCGFWLVNDHGKKLGQNILFPLS